MRYIKQTLMADEKIVFWTRPHPIVFAPAGAGLAVVLLLALFGYSMPFFQGQLWAGLSFYKLFLCLGLLYVIVAGAQAAINFYTSEYGVTGHRVMVKEGWIQRKTLEIFLVRVEAITVNQSIAGRIFGYGSLLVIGVGGSRDPVHLIPNPIVFRNCIQKAIHKLQADAQRKANPPS